MRREIPSRVVFESLGSLRALIIAYMKEEKVDVASARLDVIGEFLHGRSFFKERTPTSDLLYAAEGYIMAIRKDECGDGKYNALQTLCAAIAKARGEAEP